MKFAPNRHEMWMKNTYSNVAALSQFLKQFNWQWKVSKI